MIFFLYGTDIYRLQKKLKEIINYFIKKEKKLVVKNFDLKELGVVDFKKEILGFSFFKEKTLFIFKNISLNEEIKKIFQENLEIFNQKNDIIILIEEKEIKNDSFFEKIKKIGKFQEFLPFDKHRLKWWLKTESQKNGLKIESRAIDKLIEILGEDLWEIENEVLKLKTFKKGELITMKDVEELVEPKIEFNIFRIIDNLVTGNKRETLKQIKFYLNKGENPYFLFTMLKRNLRNILIIKDLKEKKQSFSEIKNKSQLHPFEIKKILSITQHFPMEKLKKIYNKVFALDLLIKTGKIEPGYALELFLFQT